MKQKQNDKKAKRGIFEWISFIGSFASIIGLIVGFFYFNDKIQNTIVIETTASSESGNNSTSEDVKGARSLNLNEENISNWNNSFNVFAYNKKNGYNCIKKRKKYNFEYYFLWNKNPLPIGEKATIRLRCTKNKSDNNIDNVSSNDFIVIAYTNPDQYRPLYRMFFPASEKGFIGFDVDGESRSTPKPLRVPFNIYKDVFEVVYSVEPIDDSNEVYFKYKITFISDDEFQEQIPKTGFFNQAMPVNPQNSKPFILGIGVHRDGPCFKIEKFSRDNSLDDV